MDFKLNTNNNFISSYNIDVNVFITVLYSSHASDNVGVEFGNHKQT